MRRDESRVIRGSCGGQTIVSVLGGKRRTDCPPPPRGFGTAQPCPTGHPPGGSARDHHPPTGFGTAQPCPTGLPLLIGVVRSVPLTRELIPSFGRRGAVWVAPIF